MFSIMWSRFIRALNQDLFLPSKCNAKFHQLSNNEFCDCKLWCKYPPPARPSYVQIDSYSKNSTLRYMPINMNKNGYCKTIKRSSRILRKE